VPDLVATNHSHGFQQGQEEMAQIDLFPMHKIDFLQHLQLSWMKTMERCKNYLCYQKVVQETVAVWL
jgi:hypothetical protein